ncbi:hypothetical protein [Herbiconiux daphne]|uniref:Uncharacterized protein n=1 Tax=Herbiconiux daphne TaxID=2970914 RepID=A0ABT2H775_9MICO|nr:hypothetical protein [Herbiconiux daphne]MCS5735759.1 hypothetical protein [Herbiconiux daphne]
MEQDDPDAGPWVSRLRPTIFEARKDFAALHGYLHVVTREIDRSFDAVVDQVDLDPENHDMGDVYWEAEKMFGANPLDISAHTGLMLVSRAVALSEIIFASIPSMLFVDADPFVYNGDHSWSRKMAGLFYKTCLNRPVNIADGAMKPITQLRDLYAHGYGRPRRKEEAEKLAAALHPHLGAAEPTPEERALGFADRPYVFGLYAQYDPGTGLSEEHFLPLVAELSPVATRRLILLVQERVEAALLAASWGIRDPLTEENSKFLREWAKEEVVRQEAAEAKQAQQVARAQVVEARVLARAEKYRQARAAGFARRDEMRDSRSRGIAP